MFALLRLAVAQLVLNLLREPDDLPENKFYQKFAVNTESEWASKVGKKILEKGGNALDAAIAAALAVGVVNSFSSGIGGGGFMMIKKKVNKGPDEFHFLDFRETAPMKITSEVFKNHPEYAKTIGLSVGVPGEILGFYEAHKKHGKLPWKELFEDSIKLAEGFRVTKKLAEKMTKNTQYILNDPGLSEIFTKDGSLIGEGELIRRRNYSKTLKLLSENPLDFYEGAIGDRIIEFIKQHKGIMEKEDLENYTVVERPVLESTFYDYKVISTSLPTSGLLIIQALKILEKINIRDLRHFLSRENSYKMYHILIETFKFVFAERGKLGDPDFIPDWERMVDDLISDENIRAIFNKFNVEKPLKNSDYGTAAEFKEDHGTTHLNVIDSDEMVVLITSTINLEFGSKLLDPETGIIFNNQLDDFYIPGVEQTFKQGIMAGNLVQGGKRPFSSAAPTLLIKDDELLAIGAAGGIRIPGAIISTIVYLYTGNTLEHAIALCRIHNQLNPMKTFIESTLPDDVVKKLVKMGHQMEISAMNTYFTSVQAIQLLRSGFKRKIFAISDYRKEGKSLGA